SAAYSAGSHLSQMEQGRAFGTPPSRRPTYSAALAFTSSAAPIRGWGSPRRRTWRGGGCSRRAASRHDFNRLGWGVFSLASALVAADAAIATHASAASSLVPHSPDARAGPPDQLPSVATY